MIGFDRLPRWPPRTAATLYTAIAAFVVFMAFIACIGQAAQAVAAELPTPPSLPPYTVPEAVAQRFATPATRYDTPGLQPGRSSHTSNEELRAVLHELAARAGGPRLLAAGQRTAGVAIEALHYTRGPGHPVVLLVGQQHGDEPAGAEALLAVARLLGTPAWAPLLDRIDVVVLPRANPDGAALGLRWSRSQGLRNGIGLLLETRGLGLGRNHLERRVHSHVVAVNSLLQSAAGQAGMLQSLQTQWDAQVAASACRGEVVVRAEPMAMRRDMLMLDPATGADKWVAVHWESALEWMPLTQRARPCGYWL